LDSSDVQDAFETCLLYDIELTRPLCDCLVKAVGDLLEIQYGHALQAHAQGIADVKVPISVRQEGNLRSRKIMPQIRVMIEAARVEDERKRVAIGNESRMKEVPKKRFSVGRRVLVGMANRPGTVKSVAEVPSTLGEFMHEVVLDAHPELPQKVMGCDMRAVPPLDADLHGVNQPTIQIQNSNVANLNLGAQVGTINAALQTISGGDAAQQELARAIEQLTEAVLQATLPAPDKQDVVEALSTIAEQAAKKPEERSTGTLKAVVAWLPTAISAANNLTTLWDKFMGQIRSGHQSSFSYLNRGAKESGETYTRRLAALLTPQGEC
jgi:hypothetical protein